MRLVRTLAVALSLAAPAAAALPAAAQTAPPNPGDFIVDERVPGGPSGGQPDCTPDLASLPALFMSGQTQVTALCRDTGSATGAAASGTVANPTLAASSGDPGFASGTIALICDSTQAIDFSLLITPTSSTMQRFGGAVFQACSFRMAFADAKASTLVGTIEVNARLGGSDGTVTGIAVQLAFTAKVHVTSGTGAFAGTTGIGTFAQEQTIDIGPPQGGGPAPAARQAGGDTMKLALVRKRGRARILAPAPAAGRPDRPARVTATTQVRIAATRGARCTVRASTGALVGRGTATGRFGTVEVRPEPGAYARARSIRAKCRTVAGRLFVSNRVKVRLG